MRPSLASADPTGIDPDSRAWLESLGTDGPSRERAIERLHALLLRAARYEVARRRDALRHLDHGELDDIAVQSADDALLAIRSKLDQFRGNSRFTLGLTNSPCSRLPSSSAASLAGARDSGRPRRLAAAKRGRPIPPGRRRTGRVTSVVAALQTELTPHQREILAAIALNEVPIDVLAERLGTTRGAPYKTIHDARLKLRRRLHAEGHQVDSELEGAHGG